MKTVRLKKGREASLQRRHPWVFSGAIETVEGTPDVKATAVTTATGGTGDFVANTPVEFTVGDALLSDGDIVALKSEKTASGVAVPAGIVQLFVIPR